MRFKRGVLVETCSLFIAQYPRTSWRHRAFRFSGKSSACDPWFTQSPEDVSAFIFHTSQISSKRWWSSTIKRLALQFSVCKWGYAFLRNDKIMKTSSDTMVERCFVSGTEKGHIFTKMATCTKVNGNGTESTDMVSIRTLTEKCESSYV